MDRLTDEVRKEAPWSMLFADDIVLCSKTRNEAEKDLEGWRDALKKRGMKISRAKTEYLSLNGREEDKISMQGVDDKKADDFKYLGSTVQNDGGCDREVRKRIQAGWNRWRKVTGIQCDRKLPPKVKGKVIGRNTSFEYLTICNPIICVGLF